MRLLDCRTVSRARRGERAEQAGCAKKMGDDQKRERAKLNFSNCLDICLVWRKAAMSGYSSGSASLFAFSVARVALMWPQSSFQLDCRTLTCPKYEEPYPSSNPPISSAISPLLHDVGVVASSPFVPSLRSFIYSLFPSSLQFAASGDTCIGACDKRNIDFLSAQWRDKEPISMKSSP